MIHDTPTHIKNARADAEDISYDHSIDTAAAIRYSLHDPLSYSICYMYTKYMYALCFNIIIIICVVYESCQRYERECVCVCVKNTAGPGVDDPELTVVLPN